MTPHRDPHLYGRPSRQPAGRGGWRWLLLVPVVLILPTPLYDRVTPSLFGVAFFWWYQILLVVLTSAVLTVVYHATRKHDRP